MTGKKTTSYVCNISETQLKTLREYLENRGFEFKDQQYAHFKAAGDKLNIVAYLSGKLTIQGANTEDFVQFTLEPEILHEFNFGVPKELTTDTNPFADSDVDLTQHIGVDESGKGDFFGPLIVAGVYIDEEIGMNLLKLGVKDSKVINDKIIVKMAREIRNIAQGKFAVVTLKPEIYNRVYLQINNLNKLLAWGHARVIENILEKVPTCPRALSDKFGGDYLIKNALLERGKKIKFEQRVRAESDIAVTAASILARDHFLRIMSQLSDYAGVTLPKGANNIVKSKAKEILKNKGIDVLNNCVKMHFKTYNEVINKHE